MTTTHPGAPAIRWRWIAAIWCVGAVFMASQSIVILHVEGDHLGELRLFVTEFATWLPWVLAAPAVIGLARRYPIQRRPTARGVAAHLLALIVISMTMGAWWAGLQALFNPWGHPRPPAFLETWSTTQFFQAVNSMAAYVLILTIVYMVDARDRVARQVAETARLNEELSKAQLAALRRQIEPHFMFNTLNSIAGLVRDDCKDAAVNMIVGLSELLRRASEGTHRPQVSLGEEAEYLQRYIDIQKLRFGERLRISVDIPADLLGAQVPSLLLQPLVENAIKHGVATRVAGGAVRVAGARRDGRLRLSVYNDGPAFPDDWQTTGAGVGLANLRTRLRILHGDDAELLPSRAGTDGVEVVVTLPLEEA
jgi:two-component system, LytTR family, sensor kinase